MRPISRPATLTSLALATALTLTACGSDDAGSDATPFSAGADGTSETTAGTDAETTGADATEEPTSEPTQLEVQYDVAAVELGEPGALTDPGSPLATGDPAWLNQTATYGEEEVAGQFGFGAAKNTCGLQLPGYDEGTKTLVSCIIGLSKDQPITTAMHNGEGLSFMASPDNAYFTQPLGWS